MRRRFVPSFDSLQVRITPSDGGSCPIGMPPIVEYRPDMLGSTVPLDQISPFNYLDMTAASPAATATA